MFVGTLMKTTQIMKLFQSEAQTALENIQAKKVLLT